MKNVFYLIVILIITSYLQLYSEGSWTINEQFLEQTKVVSEIQFVKYSKDGNSIFTFSRDKFLRKWDVETGNVIWEKKIDIFDYNSSFSDISNDEQYILISNFKEMDPYYIYRSQITKYDLKNDTFSLIIDYGFGEILGQIGGLPPPFAFGRGVSSLFSPNNSLIYSAVLLDLEYSAYTFTGRLDIWDANTSKHIKTLPGNHISYLTFSDDEKMIAYNSILSFSDYEGTKPSIKKTYLNDKVIDSVSSPITFTHDNSYLVGTAAYRDISNDTSITIKNRYEFSGTRQLMMSKDDRYIISLKDDSFRFFHFPSFAYAGAVYAPDTNNKYHQTRYQNMSPVNNDVAFGGYDGILRIFKGKIFNQELKSIFKSENTTYYLGDSVQFYDYSYGEPIHWLWNFGDGGSSIEQNPFHIYSDTGAYTITLIVASATEKDTMIREQYIRINEKPVISVGEIQSSQFKVISISPNPFSESTKFKYYLDKPTNVNLTIFNSLGQEIVVLCKELKPKGEHEINFNGGNLNSGLYYYKFSVGSENHFGKMILIR